MNIDITNFYKNFDYLQSTTPLYGSVSQLGNDAAVLTWNNALSLSATYNYVTSDNRIAIEQHFQEYGAWDTSELQSFTLPELNALLLQDVSASILEERSLGQELRVFTSNLKTYYYIGV